MNSVLVLVFCSAAALAQNASAPVAPYSLDYYGVPWKTGSFEKNIMKFAIGQWNGDDEVEKVDAYMTEVAQVYQAIYYNFLDECIRTWYYHKVLKGQMQKVYFLC